MLAVAGPLPIAAGWAAEVKWDGVRLLSDVTPVGAVRCWTRTGREVSATWPEVAGSVPAGLVGRFAVVDGEVVALGVDGRPSFARLQQRLGLTDSRDVARAAASVPVAFMVFDLLALDGRDLLADPWETRRGLLDRVPLGPWQVPAASPDPSALFAFTRDNGLEGVVCKRLGSPYRQGVRSPDWVKVKHIRTQEIVVGGWLPGEGGRSGELGAVLAGIPMPATGPGSEPGSGPGLLRYVGRVGTGFTAAARRDLLDRMEPLTVARSPFADTPAVVARSATWVRPELVGEVGFAEWTVNRLLRHPAWRGLRTDKSAGDIVPE